jgi:RimJ/RimL family protein N-acetyltransferase
MALERQREEHKVAHGQFISTERTILRPIVRSDLPIISDWYNDQEIRRLSGMSTPFVEQEMEEFYRQTQDARQRIWFAIESNEDHIVIGETGYQRIHPQWRTADLTLIIGSEPHRGKGYGSEVLHAILDYGFGVMNLHRVAVGIVGFNAQSIALYKKAGFAEEGVQRDGYYYDHAYHDFVMMSLLETEFQPGAR